MFSFLCIFSRRCITATKHLYIKKRQLAAAPLRGGATEDRARSAGCPSLLVSEVLSSSCPLSPSSSSFPAQTLPLDLGILALCPGDLLCSQIPMENHQVWKSSCSTSCINAAKFGLHSPLRVKHAVRSRLKVFGNTLSSSSWTAFSGTTLFILTGAAVLKWMILLT